MVDRPDLNLSFSGLKTYALNTAKQHELTSQTVADIAWAFQDAAVDTLVIKSRRALERTGRRRLVVAGGVGANRLLRQRLHEAADAMAVETYYPRAEFCTDNGAMIAYAGWVRLCGGNQQGLDIAVHPRWQLSDLPAIQTDICGEI